jgi:hypothetical protein
MSKKGRPHNPMRIRNGGYELPKIFIPELFEPDTQEELDELYRLEFDLRDYGNYKYGG